MNEVHDAQLNRQKWDGFSEKKHHIVGSKKTNHVTRIQKRVSVELAAIFDAEPSAESQLNRADRRFSSGRR